jgi:acyl-CoA hydrolase
MNPALSNQTADEARFLELIFPEQCNHYGTLFGGTALSLMGKAAFVAASRRARLAVVMAASEKVDFDVPVKIGELIELHARVVRVGRSSMTVAVEGIAETLGSGARRTAMRGRFEMVAVDDDGRPVPIPACAPPERKIES